MSKELATTYLLLDRNDITHCCGKISSEELRKEFGSLKRLHKAVESSEIFRNRYILIEDFEEIERRQAREDKAICRNENEEYFATYEGDFYKVINISRSTSARPSRRKVRKEAKEKYPGGPQTMIVTIDGKKKEAKKIIARLYDKDYHEGDIVVSKDGDFSNLSADNLVAYSRQDLKKMARGKGRVSVNSRPVVFFSEGEIADIYPSVASASRNLYCSETTIRNYCDRKVKGSINIDVRWLQSII